MIYNAFYCFEALTLRNLDDVVCGLCGVVGKVYLGDGNAKNCCSVAAVSSHFIYIRIIFLIMINIFPTLFCSLDFYIQ